MKTWYRLFKREKKMLNSGNKIEVSWVLSKICLCELTDLELWTLFSTVGIMPIDIIYIIIDFKKMLSALLPILIAQVVFCIMFLSVPFIGRLIVYLNCSNMKQSTKIVLKYQLLKKSKQDKSVILTHSILLGYYAKPASLN